MNVQCFWCEPTGVVGIRLRRYTWIGESECPSVPGRFSSHEIMTEQLYETQAIFEAQDYDGVPVKYLSSRDRDIPRDDPRWPSRCKCGYEFKKTDQYQVWQDIQYKRVDTGALFYDREKPAGAMFECYWIPRKGSDGKSLTVVLPDGVEWHIDGPSKDGGFWTREGIPPLITVRPSILTPGYHGFLTNGVLESC